MDKKTSKFIDQIIIDEVVNEKLKKVNHYPVPPENYVGSDKFFDDFLLEPQIKDIQETDSIIQFSSSVKTEYSENDIVTIRKFCIPDPKGSVFLVHGVFEEKLQMYKNLIFQLNQKKLDVYFIDLPFHFKRKPPKALFSGEFFFSANLYLTRLAFKQAIYDIYSSYYYLKNKNNSSKILIVPYSMGGCVAMVLARLYNKVDGMFVINPVCNIADMAWENQLCKPIKKDFIKAGFSKKMLEVLYHIFDPLSYDSSNIDTNKIFLAQSLYDIILKTSNYKLLEEKWKLKNSKTYEAGHVNIFKLDQLGKDIYNFFMTI